MRSPAAERRKGTQLSGGSWRLPVSDPTGLDAGSMSSIGCMGIFVGRGGLFGAYRST